MPTKKKAPKKPVTKKNASIESQGLVLDKINTAIEWIKHNPLLSVLLFAAICAALWFSYVYLIKWQFSQVEKEVNKLGSAVIAELGEPKETDLLKSCTYRSEKFAYGQTDAACSIRLLLTYDVKDTNEATIVSEKVNKITGELFNVTYQRSATFEEGRLNEASNATQDFSVHGFNCWSYVDYNGYKAVESDIPYVQISMGCAKNVNFYRIFPISDY